MHEKQKAILKAVKKNPKITVRQLQVVCGITSSSNVQHHLMALQANGIIKKVNRWEIMNPHAKYDSRPDGTGLDDGPELPLSVIMAAKRPMIIAAFKERISARACARIFNVSHDMAASVVRGHKQNNKH